MGTLMDYAELAVQFGYVTLFVVAFPLAPFLALANNYVECRSDAFKLLTQMRRPVPRGAEDIGSWQGVFTVITCIGVVTNSALVRRRRRRRKIMSDSLLVCTSKYVILLYCAIRQQRVCTA